MMLSWSGGDPGFVNEYCLQAKPDASSLTEFLISVVYTPSV
jgi:hypothetical protein